MASGDDPCLRRSRILGPRRGSVRCCVRTAPTFAPAHAQRLPTEIDDVETTAPSMPVLGHRPAIENVMCPPFKPPGSVSTFRYHDMSGLGGQAVRARILLPCLNVRTAQDAPGGVPQDRADGELRQRLAPSVRAVARYLGRRALRASGAAAGACALRCRVLCRWLGPAGFVQGQLRRLCRTRRPAPPDRPDDGAAADGARDAPSRPRPPNVHVLQPALPDRPQLALARSS